MKATLASFDAMLKKAYPTDAISKMLYENKFGKKLVLCKHGEELGKCTANDPECLVQEIMET